VASGSTLYYERGGGWDGRLGLYLMDNTVNKQDLLFHHNADKPRLSKSCLVMMVMVMIILMVMLIPMLILMKMEGDKNKSGEHPKHYTKQSTKQFTSTHPSLVAERATIPGAGTTEPR